MEQAILTQHKRNKQRGFPKGVSGNPSKKFTSENQPSGAAKSQGKLRKKRGVELIRSILDLQGKENLKERELAAEYFALAENEISIEVLMILVQIRKAIQKGDGQAFTYLMDRLYGKPCQSAQVQLSEKNTFYDFLRETSSRPRKGR